jgi:hypothetical protein
MPVGDVKAAIGAGGEEQDVAAGRAVDFRLQVIAWANGDGAAAPRFKIEEGRSKGGAKRRFKIQDGRRKQPEDRGQETEASGHPPSRREAPRRFKIQDGRGKIQEGARRRPAAAMARLRRDSRLKKKE